MKVHLPMDEERVALLLAMIEDDLPRSAGATRRKLEGLRKSILWQVRKAS